MDERKRPRLELVTTTGTINCGTAQTQSIFLSQSLAEDIIELGVGGVATSIMNRKASTTSTTTALPANVFLTICDDASSESQTEFIAINGSCMKTQNQQQDSCLLQQQQQQQQTQRATTVGMNVGLSAINAQTAAALLPASVQLPSGCEIYLVKEYVEPPPLTPTNAPRTVISTTTTITTTAQTTIAITTTASITTAAATTATNTIMTTNPAGNNCLQIVRKQAPQAQAKIISHNNNNNNNNNCLDVQDEQRSEFDKQSELLEAYKKRDDKRRATHNEVERRRRDKINSWIFKLKEMLPAEIPNYTAIDSEACNNSNSNSSTSDQQGQTTVRNNNVCRNLPCDSKSQILIKACEYIKAMQLEIKNLRDCLSETERLRECNERLQTELQHLKHEQLTVTVLHTDGHIVDDENSIITRCNGHLNDSDDAVDGHVDDLTHNINSNPNSNFNVTLNSLNTLAGNGDSMFMPNTTTNHHNLVAVMDGKRELLMRDFVD